MKLIIAGSRQISHDDAYQAAIDFLINNNLINAITEIVSGTCKGPDQAGETIALFHNKSIMLKQFPADWKTHGRAAGPIRNQQMAEYADALLLIWDGKSRGSQNMKYNMIQFEKPVYEVIITEEF